MAISSITSDLGDVDSEGSATATTDADSYFHLCKGRLDEARGRGGATRPERQGYIVSLVAMLFLSAVVAGAGEANGSPSPEQRAWWAYQPLKAVTPPQPKDLNWPRNEIDRFVLAGLESAGLPPANRADKRTLIRRATFDLTGLPPTPQEIDGFSRARDRRFCRIWFSMETGGIRSARFIDTQCDDPGPQDLA